MKIKFLEKILKISKIFGLKRQITKFKYNLMIFIKKETIKIIKFYLKELLKYKFNIYGS